MNEPLSNNYAQLITISGRENDAAEIESHLREQGLPVRMKCLKPDDDLADRLLEDKIDLIFCDQHALETKADCLHVCTRALPYTPVLLLADKIDIGTITGALHKRARDVVSTRHFDHLCAVYLRELGICRLYEEIKNNRLEIEGLEQRLEAISSSSEAVVANIQEGIIVEANPGFRSLLGFDEHTDPVGWPFMDLVHTDHQPDVKKQISRCSKGRNYENHFRLTVNTVNGNQIPAEMALSLVQVEGEPAVELLIKSLAPAGTAEPTGKEDSAEQTGAPGKAATGKAKPADKRKPKSKKADPRIEFYKSLENPKHYPPKGFGLSLAYVIADDSARLKKELGLADADNFLGRIAEFLNNQMPGARIYRLATDEFVLVAPGKLFKHGELFASNFRKQINSEVFDYEGKSVIFTISIAITLVDELNNSGACFAEVRDLARRLSAEGGDRVAVCASAQTAEQTKDPVEWQELQMALDNNRLRMATRPIASLEGDSRHYYEVYPRIPDEKGNLKAVEDGGPQNTHTELQQALDRQLIKLSLGLMKRAADNNQESGVFVPISNTSLEHADESIEWLLEEHGKLNLGNNEIVLCLSESILVPHIHRLNELIKQIKGKPIKFAINDCVGNEQSLRLIQHLPGDYLRLTAQSTLALCDSKNNKSKGLHEAVSIAREHGYKIVAAATGDAHSMAVLWQLGVNYVEAGEIEEPAAA